MVPEGRNRDTDIEKGHVDTGWERAGGTSWESSPDMYTPSCVNQQLAGSCHTSQELSFVLCDDRDGWDVGAGREVKREGIYVYIQLIPFAAQQK